jgi:hypothetical protein
VKKVPTFLTSTIKLLVKLLYKKTVPKMLVKLTPDVSYVRTDLSVFLPDWPDVLLFKITNLHYNL